MAEAFEERVLAERFEGRREVVRVDGSPADYASDDARFCGEFEEPASLFEGLPRLHCHGSVNAGCGGFARQVIWQEVSLEDGHRVVDPAVFLGGVSPQMMV